MAIKQIFAVTVNGCNHPKTKILVKTCHVVLSPIREDSFSLTQGNYSRIKLGIGIEPLVKALEQKLNSQSPPRLA